MTSFNFSSCLSEEIKHFIKLRCLSGTEYESQIRLLWYFDKFLNEQNINPCITRQVISAYQQSLSQLAPRTQENRLCVVRQLCKYISLRDPQCYVPDSMRTISSSKSCSPYIFNCEEIRSLLVAASQLPPLNSLRPKTYYTLIGLLYSTGIRISEAIALNLKDFNKIDQWLYVAEGKFRKSHIVILSNSTCQALQKYLDSRLREKPCCEESPLLINQRCTRLNYVTVNHTFRQLLKLSQIPLNQQKSPRIRDVRHYAEFLIMKSCILNGVALLLFCVFYLA